MRKRAPVSKRVSSRFIYLITTLILGFSTLHAEQVGKILYKGFAEQLNDTTIQVPRDIVALSEQIYVSHPDSLITVIDTPSIFFIIDHSGSMYEYDYDSANSILYPPKDPMGNRFKVVRDLIDTLSNKRRFPGIEVGVAVFGSCLYYDTSDGITVTVSGEPGVGPFDDGGYIPLLKLDRDYNGKTGAEIIKEKLQTKTVQGRVYVDWAAPDTVIEYEWVDLTAPSTFFFNGATDINIGFTAEKKAMRSSTYDKKNHYGIFFSDGEANDGNPVNAYVTGANVPTNFTIFFTDDGQAPQNLINMNTNIQNNGYSSSNPLSTLWPFENTTYDTLMTFLMKNIISIFEQNITVTPKNIVINGVSDSVVWDGEKFIFPGLIPLTGKITDFDYDIQYTFRYDSIDVNGDTHTVEIDTAIVTDFSVEVDFNMTTAPDTFKVAYWDRTLTMHHNGSQITAINDENMLDFEVQFAFSPVDTAYEYSKVKVDIANSRGTQRDLETITLTKQGSADLFTATFQRECNPSAINPGDGVLQHYIRDTLIVTFRNDETPKLPLDTLCILIPIKLNDPVDVQVASYHDINADGYIDSIGIKATTEIPGGLTETHVRELFDSAATLPSFRNFTINSHGLLPDGLYITVTEDKAHDPVTYVTADDKITFTEHTFSMGGLIEAGQVLIADKVAPVIHWKERSALLKEYHISGASDTLGVKFSEPVRNTSSDEPFYFLDAGSGSNYSVTLRAAGMPAIDSMVFEVVSTSGTMEEGDSLWVHETDLIGDTLGNYQNNTGNVKRKLYVDKVYGSIAFERGYYFDRSGDGFVDSIYVKASTNIAGGLTETLVEEVIDRGLTLPAFRSLTVNGSSLTSGGFSILVTEGADNPTTYITNEDKLVIKQVTLANGGTTQAKTVTVIDKVAPLIHWGGKSALAITHQDESVTDTLSITFSEPMKKVNATEPFHLLSIQNNTAYSVNLSLLDQPSSDKMVFEVLTLNSSMDKMRDGDSIWIYEGDRVGDECKDEAGNTVTNFQNNLRNTKRRLYVERRLLPFKLIPVAVTPLSVNDIEKSDKFIIPDSYIRLFEEQGVFNDLRLRKNDDGKYVGMIINVVPDDLDNVFEDFRLKGHVTILDPVGNRVIEKKKMGWDDEKKRLIFAWNVKNSNGRYVGSGAYLSLIEIEETTAGPENSGLKEIKKQLVGVR